MVTSKHVESIRGAVDELAHLEALAQSSFWSIRSRYCGAASVSEDVDMVGGRGDGSGGSGEIDITGGTVIIQGMSIYENIADGHVVLAF